MGSENMEMGHSDGCSNQVNSRWNPTKEQISMLESMYKHGVRTPTADQIQQITSRLKAFGNIEGKNVFYWFQNHKARQRQKQKQENLASFNRFLHHPVLAAPHPPCPNVVCGSYYLPQNDLGFYPQYPKVLLPNNGFKRRQRTEKMEKARASHSCTGSHKPALPRGYINNSKYIVAQASERNHKTLPLFPLHPTGNLVQDKEMSLFADNSAEESVNTTPSSSSEAISGVDEGSTDKPFFDFLSGQE